MNILTVVQVWGQEQEVLELDQFFPNIIVGAGQWLVRIQKDLMAVEVLMNVSPGC